VIGSDQPLLEIPNGAVCQRQYQRGRAVPQGLVKFFSERE
jgi:hypothetical protein